MTNAKFHTILISLSHYCHAVSFLFTFRIFQAFFLRLRVNKNSSQAANSQLIGFFYVSVRINKITHISTFPIARAQVFPDPCKASNGEETNKHKKPKAVNTPHLKGR